MLVKEKQTLKQIQANSGNFFLVRLLCSELQLCVNRRRMVMIAQPITGVISNVA